MTSLLRSRRYSATTKSAHGGFVNTTIRTCDGCLNEMAIDKKCSGKQLWQLFVNTCDIDEQDFFGLQYEAHPGKELKLRSSSGSYSLDKPSRHWLGHADSCESQVGSPRDDKWEFDFRVRFYVDAKIMRDWSEYAQRLFYLQLRDDVVSNRIWLHSDHDHAYLAALSCQIHLRDWESGKNSSSEYICQIDSPKLKTPEFADKVAQIHKTLCGTTSARAQEMYVEFLSTSPTYGMESYSCMNSSRELRTVNIGPMGIRIVGNEGQQTHNIPWQHLTNVENIKRKVNLSYRTTSTGATTNVTVYSSTKSASKALYIALLQQKMFFGHKQRGVLDQCTNMIRRESRCLQDIQNHVGENTSKREQDVKDVNPTPPPIRYMEADVTSAFASQPQSLRDAKHVTISSLTHSRQSTSSLSQVLLWESTRDQTNGDMVLLDESQYGVPDVPGWTTPASVGAGTASIGQSMNASSCSVVPSFGLVGGEDGIFISSVHLEGQNIRVGDQILAISGVSTAGMTIATALEMIHAADQRNELELDVIDNETGFAPFALQLQDGMDESIVTVLDRSMVPPPPPKHIGLQSPMRLCRRGTNGRVVSTSVLHPLRTATSAHKSTCAMASLPTHVCQNEAVASPPVDTFGKRQLPFHVRTAFAVRGDADASNASNASALAFACGDVLEVLEFVDENTWIASHLSTHVIGEIPSAAAAVHGHMGITSTAPYEVLCKGNVRAVVGAMALRPLVLLGAGVAAVKQALRDVPVCSGDGGPARTFVPVVRHTSRPRKEEEVDGQDYHFVTDAVIKQHIANNNVVDVGTYDGYLYAVTASAVLEACRHGDVVILDTSVQAVEQMRSICGISPVTVYLEGGGQSGVCRAHTGNVGDDAPVAAFKQHFGGYFTKILASVASETAVDTARRVAQVMEVFGTAPYWVRESDGAGRVVEGVDAGARDVAPAAYTAPLTTRLPRAGEHEGDQYHFVTKDVFEGLVHGGTIVDWGIFNNEYYGVAVTTGAADERDSADSSDRGKAPMRRGGTVDDVLKGATPMTMKEKIAKRRIEQGGHGQLEAPNTAPDHNDAGAGPSLKERVRRRSHVSSDAVPNSTDPNIVARAEEAAPASTAATDGAHVSSTTLRSTASSRADSHVVEVDVRSYLNTVTLVRNAESSFGLTITGGTDFGALPSVSHLRNVSIIEATLRDVRVGDVLLAINGVSLATASHDATIAMLRHSPSVLTLLLLPVNGSHGVDRNNVDSAHGGANRVSVVGGMIPRSDSTHGGFGFTVEREQSAGKQGKQNNNADGTERTAEGTVEDSITRTMVASVDAESAAARWIKPGMHLLTINGQDVSAMSVEGVSVLLSSVHTATLTLRVVQPHDPAPSAAVAPPPHTPPAAPDDDESGLDNGALPTKTGAPRSALPAPLSTSFMAVTLHKRAGEYGVRLGLDKRGRTVVLSVTSGGPGDGRVFPGDRIVAINGIAVHGTRRAEAFGELKECEAVVVIVGMQMPQPWLLMDSARISTVNQDPAPRLYATEMEYRSFHSGDGYDMDDEDEYITILEEDDDEADNEAVPTLSSLAAGRVPDTDTSLDVFCVRLERSARGLGIEVATVESGSADSVIYVSRVIHDGVAEASGCIREGDVIHEVDGVLLGGKSHGQAVELLVGQNSSSEITVVQITVHRTLSAVACGTRTVYINRQHGEQLGLKVVAQPEGVTVASAAPDMAAGKAGILVGDQIIAVNGVKLLGKSYKEVRTLFSRNIQMAVQVQSTHQR